MLTPGASTLCPNALTPTSYPAWDAATGVTPWFNACGVVDEIFKDGFESA
jgi:hypothetical protein